MTGKWGTWAQRIYTGGNPYTASREVGISYRHPEFEPTDGKDILKSIGPNGTKPKHNRKPRSSNKIKKAR